MRQYERRGGSVSRPEQTFEVLVYDLTGSLPYTPYYINASVSGIGIAAVCKIVASAFLVQVQGGAPNGLVAQW